MMLKIRKFTGLLLCICMLLSLCACGGEKPSANGSELTSGMVYVPEFIDCDLSVQYVSSGCSDGQYIYIVAEIEEKVKVEGQMPETDMPVEPLPMPLPMPGGIATDDVVFSEGAVTEDVTVSTDIAVDDVVVDTDISVDDGAVWDEGFYAEEQYEYIYRTAIFRISMDGTEVAELENYVPTSLPEETDGNVNINSIRVTADGKLWVTENIYTYSFDLPEDFDPDTQDRWQFYTEKNYQLQRQLDHTGKELASVDTSGLSEKLQASYMGNTVIDDAGNFYTFCEYYSDTNYESKIVVLNKDLEILFEIKENNLWGNMVLLGDGTVGMAHSSSDQLTGTYRQVLHVIDLEKKGWGAEYVLPMNAYNAYTGSRDYLFYYDNGDSLYGYDVEKEAGEKLLTWSSADINRSDLQFFTFLEDGRIVTMCQQWGMEGPKMELAILTQRDASVLANRTILTYATMYLSYDMRNRIIEFNKSNPDYRIEIKDYSEYNTEEDYSAGLTKLNTEIVAGMVPDILDTGNNLPIQQYGGRGLLEDLWPYIESDPDLGRQAVMEEVLEAASDEGKLYQVFSSFSISTVAGATDIVGDKLSWTLADMETALAKMPEGCTYFSDTYTKDNVLSNVISQNINSFVDWKTGQCYFDSPTFISLLKFCDSFPVEFDYENVDWELYEDDMSRVRTGKQMLYPVYLYDFQSIQMYKAMFGGKMTFVGYPKEDGSVGSSFSIGRGLAMSTTCKDKEAAWNFIRELLLPRSDSDDYYYSYEFSVNRQDFERMVENAMRKSYVTDEYGQPVLDENGQPVEQSQGSWGWDDMVVEIYATSQEEYDQFMELYRSIESITSYDEKIYGIVSEVASRYFSGEADAETTAAEIQSRVRIYINENR